MTPPHLTLVRARPPCCDAGRGRPGHCPWHDRWRTVRFVQPPPIPDDEEDDE